ncbi:PAS domain-containing protein [Agrobacterium tumefaciens]|uniref:histidine kinase n=1 Tax=Agrobacterium tumefaciens TaxID=358 RepID=A0AA44F539_AGRTU|nr:PAS domain-containing protein [Agrobacterium tumefaciens]NTB87645.1 PAS domain-containing protein [Agrobacterium tumefaciens]NTC19987.1 PAS domain-containing protein [Agrobacterium tumefaciens]NTC29806.1 PAS domain-containing protein [Agrobacterium tumefaciens]
MPTTSLLGFDSTSQTNGDVLHRQRMSGISSRHFLKLLEDQGRVGFWSVDFETGYINGSVGLYRLLGLPPFTTLDFADLIKMMHPEDRVFNSDMLVVIRSGQPIERDFRIIRRDKTLRWIENKAEVLVDTDGVPTRALGLMTDVTEHHEARMVVEQGWQSYQSLISAIAAVKLRMLPDGRITSLLNWEELSGQTSAEADNWGWLEAIHPDEREAARSLWSECALTGRSYAIDVRIRCADRLFRRYLVRGAPICNPDGTVREWIGVLIETAAANSSGSDPLLVTIEALDIVHIRAARALLNWSIEDLSVNAHVSISTIQRLERGVKGKTRLHHMEAILKALERGGVRFGRGLNAEITVGLAN